jgi:hypothetical protein
MQVGFLLHFRPGKPLDMCHDQVDQSSFVSDRTVGKP